MDRIRKLLCHLVYFMIGSPGDVHAEGNPFPECLDSRNCFRTSITVTGDISDAYDKMYRLLKEGSVKTTERDEFRIDAVFRIPIFGFKDDVYVQLEPSGSNAMRIHFRSASRVGRSDLGVNKRRIDRLIRELTNSFPEK